MSTHALLRPLLVAALLFLPGVEAGSAAETIPPFDLHRRTEQADLIVHGRLDPTGHLTVEATLRGKPGTKRLVLTNGTDVFASLQRVAGQAGPVEVVAYLRIADGGRWTIDTGVNGVVGFVGNGSYLVHDSGGVRWGAVLAKHPTLLRGPFLADARAAVAALERRREILGLPPSAERVRQLVRFLEAQQPAGRRHHQHAASARLRPLAAVEEQALAALLTKPDSPVDRVVLLELAADTARDPAVFKAAASHLDRRQPAAVRRAAIHAVAAIDPYRAQEQLAPLLDVAEGELRDVLQALRQGEPFRLNPVVVDPLRKLTEAFRQRQQRDRHALANESYALAGVLRHYGHPRLLAGLVAWVRADDHVSANQAESELRAWTGLGLRENPRAFEAWWGKAEHVLGAEYNLREAAGRERWYTAWLAGNAGVRQILLRLWAFEPAIDEPSLIREAAGAREEGAKAVLATLWKHGRLSGKAKKTIVEKFLTVELEEVPLQDAGARRELRIVGRRRFPFPPEAWVRWRAAIEIGDRKPALDDSWNSRSLGESEGPLSLGSLGGGSHPGRPEARAILEVWEQDSHGDKAVVWKHQWNLGPIRLREAK
jgi:hypothetical protein